MHWISFVPDSFEHVLSYEADGKCARYFKFRAKTLNSSCPIIGYTANKEILFAVGEIAPASSLSQAERGKDNMGCGSIMFTDRFYLEEEDEHVGPLVAATLYLDDFTYDYVWEASSARKGAPIAFHLGFSLSSGGALDECWDVSMRADVKLDLIRVSRAIERRSS